jgi:hypothetical protein
MNNEDSEDAPDFVGSLRAVTDEAAPCTKESRARIAFADMARNIAEAVIRLVRVNEPATDMGLINEVNTFVKASQGLLTRAVVAARADPAQSWEKIGSTLGMTRQSAQARFGAAVDAWDAWEASVESGEARPADVRDITALAAELDDWLLRHRDPDMYLAHPDKPVSGGLVRMNPDEEVADITRRERLLWQQHDQPPLDQLAALADREAVLHDRMAGIGLNPAGERQAAARCRALAAGYRAQAAATTGPRAAS